jgi:protein-disulfide isomerase
VRSPALHLLVVLGLLAGGTRARAEDRPIVAVFNIEAKRAPLKAELLRNLSDYLAAQLAASGAFSVVPRDRLRSELVKQKKASYKDCYSQTCQIEIGQELAAQKALSTQILKLAGKCVVSSTLFDLKRAATDRAATSEGGCGEAALMTSIRTVATRLAGSGPDPVTPTSQPGRADLPGAGVGLSRGPVKAAVVIEEFVDYQSWPCHRSHQVMAYLIKMFPGRVRHVHRDYPIDSTCNPKLTTAKTIGCRAAYFARCAAGQGKFAAMDDALFDMSELNEVRLLAAARRAQLDLGRLESCVNSPSTRQAVLADITLGAKRGLRGVPTAFVNGQRVTGEHDLKWWTQTIRDAPR